MCPAGESSAEAAAPGTGREDSGAGSQGGSLLTRPQTISAPGTGRLGTSCKPTAPCPLQMPKVLLCHLPT